MNDICSTDWTRCLRSFTLSPLYLAKEKEWYLDGYVIQTCWSRHTRTYSAQVLIPWQIPKSASHRMANHNLVMWLCTSLHPLLPNCNSSQGCIFRPGSKDPTHLGDKPIPDRPWPRFLHYTAYRIDSPSLIMSIRGWTMDMTPLDPLSNLEP